ncbi:DUF2156 domain-containing protein [Pseudarthrobacter sp. J64]|uniref:bifunctional lysylphosphatidylglycerol flippase/synthetase MprF n=1 Tax=Pseudarthrobacter sp. J64 TaxID=3116485 RepID=UPI002E822588|nr:DUF2156 domain-containing protein [Pseudarthrobacter sp. J64]MEE2568401.1 DUF2156 domain-containing protein [Pseudarthrobacter sp. J64]
MTQRVFLLLRGVPFTLSVLAVFLLAGAFTGSFLAGPPEPLMEHAGVSGPGLRSGNWWSLFTALFFATNPLAYVAASGMILLLVGLTERSLGSLQVAALFFAGQFGAVTLFLLLSQVAHQAGDGWIGGMADDILIGPYAAVLAVCLAASGRLPVLWKRRLRATVLSASIMLVLYVGHAEAVVGLIGALLGLGFSRWNRTESEAAHHQRSTEREVRHLLALIVAVFAVGPVLSGVARSPVGPLAFLRDVVVNPLPTLNQLEADCGQAIQASCLNPGHQGIAGPAGLALAIVPVVLLLICADGMRRGRRLALQIAIVIQLGVTALAGTYVVLFALMPRNVERFPAALLDNVIAHFLPLAAVPLLLAAVLWFNRRHFRVESAPLSRRKLAAVVGGTFVALAVLYSAAWLAAGGMSRDGGLLGLAAELARQFVPVPIPAQYHRIFTGRDSLEEAIFAFSGPVFWTVALAAVWTVFLKRPRVDARTDDKTAVRALLRQGGGPLSWMALWEPNTYWFSSDGQGGIAYQQHGNVALTLGGPFGSAGAEPVVREFLAHCTAQALIPALYSCDGTLWPYLRDRGFQRVAVAQETRLAVREIEFKGKEWQNVRTALNRAAKLEVRAVWGTYRELPGALRSKLSEVSEAWASAKSVPEMGFTLGGIDQLDDDEVLCCLAVGPDGTVHGVTSWLPVYDGGRLVSRTLDVMRRGDDGFPGVMEFLIATAVLELRNTVDTISLSGSPLARHPDTQGPASPVENLAAILDVVGHALEPLYGFRSLAAFKSRFKPEYRGLYLYYQDALHLPAIGRALTRAYLPGLSLRQGARLVRSVVGQRTKK